MRAAALLVIIILAGCSATETITIDTADGPVILTVEIADEEHEQRQGLMHRDSLDAEAGMLFVFEDERTRAFWMRNTTIPLSIAFIASDGRIIDIRDLEPLNETPVVSAAPARYALEVNKGFFAARGITINDTVEI